MVQLYLDQILSNIAIAATSFSIAVGEKSRLAAFIHLFQQPRGIRSVCIILIEVENLATCVFS